MAFSGLNADLQEIIMFNFETFGKFALIFGLFLFCIYFVKSFNVAERSPFFAIRYLKGVSFIICKIYMFLFPLTIFLLYPQVGIDPVLVILIAVYSTLFVIFGLIIMPINMVLYGAGFAYELMGSKSSTVQVKNEVNKITGGVPK